MESVLTQLLIIIASGVAIAIMILALYYVDKQTDKDIRDKQIRDYEIIRLKSRIFFELLNSGCSVPEACKLTQTMNNDCFDVTIED